MITHSHRQRNEHDWSRDTKSSTNQSEPLKAETNQSQGGRDRGEIARTIAATPEPTGMSVTTGTWRHEPCNASLNQRSHALASPNPHHCTERDKTHTMIAYSHPPGGMVSYSHPPGDTDAYPHPPGGMVAYSHPPGALAITCICAKLELDSADGLAARRGQKGRVGVVRDRGALDLATIDQ